jgi:hypothetical protein
MTEPRTRIQSRPDGGRGPTQVTIGVASPPGHVTADDASGRLPDEARGSKGHGVPATSRNLLRTRAPAGFPGTALAIVDCPGRGVRSMRRWLATTILVCVALPAGLASATPIGPGAFGPLATVESFEGHVAGPNISLGLGQSLLLPGTVSAFSFASGVVLSNPVPNPGVFNEGAFVHDFALGSDVQNNWGGTRVVNDAGDVPFGSAYLGAFDPATGTALVEFTFAAGMLRVGAYVTGFTGTTVQLDVYGTSGLLESHTVSTVALGQWSSNFLGIENAAGIVRVVFRGQDFGLDGLTFEPNPIAVPEPNTLAALAFGLVGLLGIAMLGRQKAATHARAARR